jgi:hypothetical protein
MLVGGFNHLEKYESQFHILWKVKECSKPPTRMDMNCGFLIARFVFLEGNH